MQIKGKNMSTKEPLCVFGPGGDFIWSWPRHDRHTIIKLMNGQAAGTIFAQTGVISERLCPHCGSQLLPASRSESLVNNIEGAKIRYGFGPTSTGKPYAAPAAAAESHIGASEEQLLFADDFRAGQTTAPKQKHNIRAYRRASKKRVSSVHSRQGSFFEAGCGSVRIA